jgi:hypothetical protein
MRGLALFLLLLCSVLVVGCGQWPPLSVSVDNFGVQVDVRRFGEYSTSVSRVRLSLADTSEIVWEAVNSDSPQIPGFRLVIGENPQLPQNLSEFGFRSVIPTGDSGFHVRKGVMYRIEAWSKSQKRVASETFLFPIG